MSKYEPLQRWLRSQSHGRIPLTFAEIETIIGAPLPPSRLNRAWWSNNPSNNVMTKEWLAAGYETEQVDIAAERLVFRKVVNPGRAVTENQPRLEPAGLSERAQAKFESETTPMDDIQTKAAIGKKMLEALYAEMGGLVTFAPGFDPADMWAGEEWPDPELPEPRTHDGDGRDERR